MTNVCEGDEVAGYLLGHIHRVMLQLQALQCNCCQVMYRLGRKL